MFKKWKNNISINKHKEHTTNSGSISITTSSDTLYQVAKDIAEIKTELRIELKDIKQKIDDHEERIKNIENRL